MQEHPLEQRALLRALLDQDGPAIGVVDQTGTIVYTNRRAQQLLNHPLVGTDVTQFDDEAVGDLRSLLAGEIEQFRREQCLPAGGGRTVHGELRAYALPASAAAGRCAALVFDDRTEHRNAREQLARQTAVLDALPITTYAVDLDGTISGVVGGSLQMLGLSASDYEGRDIREVNARRPLVLAAIDKAFAGESQRIDVEWGDHVVRSRIAPRFDESGAVVGLSCLNVFATEQVRTLQAHERRAVAAQLQADVSARLADVDDLDAGLQDVARMIASTLGDGATIRLVDADDRASAVAVVHPDPGAADELRRIYDGLPLDASFRIDVDERAVSVRFRVMPECDWPTPLRGFLADHRPHGFAMVPMRVGSRVRGVLQVVRVHDERPFDEQDRQLLDRLGERISLALGARAELEERRRAERRLQVITERQAAIIELGALAMAQHDLDTMLGNVAEVVARTIGAGAVEIVEDSSTSGASFVRAASEGARGGDVLDVAIDLPAGRYGAIRVFGSNPSSGDELFVRMIAALVSAVLERQHAERELQWHAMHDPLTGLPNRSLLFDRIEQALRRHRRDAGVVAVMLLDLDRFKLVNDGLGHLVGDELLVAVADRLRSLGLGEDTVARLGGDEFVILHDGVRDADDAVELAERVLAALVGPLAVGDEVVHVSASIGIAVARVVDGEPTDATSLLRDADAAMYRAKERGGAGAALFDDDLRAAALRRLRLEADLRRTVAAGELTVHFQPIVGLDDGRIDAVEALVRWDRHGTMIPPDEFLPIAEAAGVIGDIDRWVLCEGLRFAERTGCRVHVNVSARHIAATDLVARVRALLDVVQVPASRLCIEITETALADDPERFLETLRALRALGVELSIDDFGTGYSSLAYLQRFPVSNLKIDRVFVADITVDPNSASIVASVIALAHALGLRVIAEGVATEAHAVALRAMGCDDAQGFHFSPARPSEEIEPMLRTTLTVPPSPTMRTGDGRRLEDLAHAIDEMKGRLGGGRGGAGGVGGAVLSSPMRLARGGVFLDARARIVSRDGAPVELTRREFDLLVHLAAEPGRVFSREELLREVWGSRLDWQDPATVTEHVRRLRHKLEVDPSEPTLIQTVRGVGYRFAAA